MTLFIISQPKLKRGILLVFIFGIISILALIVFTFFTLTSTAKKILSFYHYQVKSQFASQSGLELAYAKMRYHVQKNPLVNVNDSFYYKGEVNNVETWDFTDINNNNFPDTTGIDVYDAMEPSFTSKVSFYTKNNKNFYFSGIVEETDDFRSVYKLKVVDMSSLIYIGNVSGGAKNILNNLSKILDYPVFLGEVISSVYLDKGKIRSFNDIKDVLVFSQSNILSNFLSLEGWQYPNLVYANNSREDNKSVQSGYEYLRNSLKNISIENRAPLNINLIPPMLIKANLYNLSANVLVEKPDDDLDIPQNISLDEAIKIFNNSSELIKYATKVRTKKFPRLGYTKNYNIDNVKIDKLVDLILQQRVIKPFNSYDDFYNFMLSSSGKTGLSKVEIDIIYANVNPSFNLQKFNLNKNLKKEVDKTDLVNQTLEFIFFTPGKFYIESAGYLFHKKSGELLAKDLIKASFDAYEIVTLNKEEDFYSGWATFNEFAKLYRGVSYGPFDTGYRKNKLNQRGEMPGFIQLGLVSNKITTDDITYCDTFEFANPTVGHINNDDFVVFYDGIYSSGDIPFNIPISKNFPIVDFKDIFGIPYKCDMFKNTALEQACGKITRGTFCFWIKPAYKVVDSSRIRTLVYIQSEDPQFEKTGNINYIDSFIVSFVPMNFVKNMVTQYFPMFAPYTKFTLATPFFLWTPKVNPTYLSLISSANEVINDGEWTHICLQWDSVKTIERNLGAKIFINGSEKTFLFGNDYTPDFTRMFQYFAPNFSNAKYIVFGSDKHQKYWNFPLEATLDNIVISKKLYTKEEIVDLFYKGGRYVNKDVFWQSQEFYPNNFQKPLFAYTNYVAVDRVKMYLSILNKEEEDKKVLLPLTIFDNIKNSSSLKLRIYFEVLNSTEPLLETPIITDIHLFFSRHIDGLNMSRFEVLLDSSIYRK